MSRYEEEEHDAHRFTVKRTAPIRVSAERQARDAVTPSYSSTYLPWYRER